jgi:hypothetical protein
MNSYPKNDITLRDWFAGLAMQGLLAAQIHGFNDRPANGPFASMAYEMADAMLKAREAKETDLWRCTVCGRIGTVGRCCGEETRERVEALALLPDEIDMIEHNPDEGPRMFCCGRKVLHGFHGPLITHNEDCWYAQMRAIREQKENRND